MGVPVISLDPMSPAWPVSCHGFGFMNYILSGQACRPYRSQWLADIAYSMWTVREIEDGEPFRYLFGLGQYKELKDRYNETLVPTCEAMTAAPLSLPSANDTSAADDDRPTNARDAMSFFDRMNQTEDGND